MTVGKTPTHRLTALGSGQTFLISLPNKGSYFFWYTREGGESLEWVRASNFYFYTNSQNWKVEELNRFRGNV